MDPDGDVDMSDPDKINGFAPFASELDWRIADWVVKEGPGHKAFNRLLDIPGVRKKLGLSYSNIRGLHQIIDQIPERAVWATKTRSFPDCPDEKYTIRHRDPLEAIRSLLGNPAHAKDIVYVPKQIFSSNKKDNRVFNEMWTGQWWAAAQSKIPKDAALAPVIIATDKTQLTQFSGSKSAYPVYLTLGNLPKALRRKPSENACILLGYLSCDKIVRKGLSKKTIKSRNQKLFHASMHLILQPLISSGNNGMEVLGGDGCVRNIFPILASYVADYPEQCLVGCAKYGTCPKCQRKATDLQDPTPGPARSLEWTLGIISAGEEKPTENQFHDHCMHFEVAGIQKPFWQGFPLTNLAISLTPDAMARILLGCLIGRMPIKGITASQYSTHDEGTLACMTDALKIWHQNRDYFITAGVRKDFNIPKFHSLLHYVDSIRMFGTTDNYNTEMFERLHIDFAKKGWRASNRRDKFPQMIAWLNQSTQKPALLPIMRTFTRQAVKLAKTAQSPRQLLSWLAESHHSPSFIPNLKSWLQHLGNHQLTPQQLKASILPFSRVDVHHSFKFEPTSLDPGDDLAPAVDPQTVIARPADTTSPARHTSWARQIIFTLPTTLDDRSPAPQHWPNYPVAYVEWFSTFKTSHEQHHHMYAISRPPPRTDGTVMGSIIPLSDIRQVCQLFPNFGRADVDKSWTSDNVLDQCKSFFVNNWASRYAYQSIW
ncbi:hypothetical protein DFH08DRAFT_916210 [Mycena albidolilacea]|uniref:Uncharacterized protein n=1 Tax=Mycena albidolilacea TaxID=1033008 RepID=A0AAD6ZR77_9AGAR|nr:hypothetical protein DFH08DRAFT_916210 [Mycena albidolilacea]